MRIYLHTMAVHWTIPLGADTFLPTRGLDVEGRIRTGRATQTLSIFSLQSLMAPQQLPSTKDDFRFRFLFNHRNGQVVTPVETKSSGAGSIHSQVFSTWRRCVRPTGKTTEDSNSSRSHTWPPRSRITGTSHYTQR